MKNFWKLFTASVTGLKSDFFTKQGVRYASALVGFIAISSLVVYAVVRPILDRLIRSGLPVSIENGSLKQETVSVLLEKQFIFFDVAYIILILIVCVVSFVFVAIMLHSMRDERLLQKKFLSDISHQLRTPLSIIKTTSEIAVRTSETLTKQDALITIRSNLKEVDRMTELLELALAKFHTDVSPFTKFNVSSVNKLLNDTKEL